MAYGVVHQFAGGTKEQYEASIAAVHPSDGSLPKGQLSHAAGPSADGWTIVAIHDSKASWRRARHVKDRPSTVCSAVNASPRRTLMPPLIAMRTPFGSAGRSLMAWLK